MRAILMSVHAKWCALMMTGKKKIEVRKGTALYKAIQKLIDEYGYADIYVYCTKDKKERLIIDIDNRVGINPVPYCYGDEELNGKVIFKFRCYNVEEIINECVSWDTFEGGNEMFEKKTQSLSKKELEELSCLSYDDLDDYLGWCKEGKVGCAIHISDLEIFDEPKELSEFRKYNNGCLSIGGLGYSNCPRYCLVTKAPQSFQYIEIE